MSGKHTWFGSDYWEPVTLKTPELVRHAREGAMQRGSHGRLISALGLLVIYLALQILIPARLVIGGMGAAGRPSVAVGLLLAFLWVLSAVRQRGLPDGRQPIRWAVGAFLAVQLIGSVVGFDRLATAGEVSAGDRWLIVTVAFAGVVLAVTDGIRSRAELDRLLLTLVGLASAMSIVGVLQFFGVVDLTEYIRPPGLQVNFELIGISARGDGDFPRVPGTANHYIEFGVVLALVLPVALHYALFSPPGVRRWVRWVALGLVALGIPLSISRAAIVTVLVTMGMMAVIWPWRQRYNALVLGVMAAAAFHVLNRGVLGTIMALFTFAEYDPSVTARIERTETVMDLWHRRPLLGWGSGMVTPEEYLLLDNQIYMFLIAGGVLGVTAFLVLFFVPYVLGRSVRLRGSDQEARHLGHALAVTMPAAVLVSGTFDSFSFATFVGVMGILIGATGALWRLDGTTVSRPLQVAHPGDKFVTTPLTADLSSRLHAVREGLRSRSHDRPDAAIKPHAQVRQ